MTTPLFSYRGYTGSIEVSLEDECLYGRILYVADLVNYEANSVDELRKAFEEAVDDYITVCEQQGRKAEQPLKGSFNVRIGAGLHQQAALAAKKTGISLNEFVKQAVNSAIHPAPHTELIQIISSNPQSAQLKRAVEAQRTPVQSTAASSQAVQGLPIPKNYLATLKSDKLDS